MEIPRTIQRLIAFIFCLTCIMSNRAFSQVLRGAVVDEDSVAIANAAVSIPSIARTTFTESGGTFFFDGVPGGTYLLKVNRIGYDSSAIKVSVSSDTTSIIIVMHGNFVTLHTITVTAKPQPSDVANSSQSVSVIEGRQLRTDAGSAVTSELSDLPAVTMVHSGPFSVKPVIRGLGYQRVVVLEDGERHDYQSWDDDDSPGIDALSLERIEVIRGPNSVLYGSDALGGVVNFIHDDGIMGSPDSSAMRGKIVFSGFSNNTEGASHVGLGGTTSLGKYYADLTVRGAGDVRTPKGVMPNTGATEINFEGAVSTDRPWGNLLLGYSRFDQNREILPVGDDSGSESPYQSTVHDRLWLSYKSIPSPIQFSLNGVLQQNDAAEYEDEDDPVPENHLRLRAYSLDAKVYYDETGNNSATLGISAAGEQNATLAEEPVIPAYNQSTVAAFLFDDYQLQLLDVSIGARYDYRTLQTSDNATLDLVGQTRNYQAATGSLGLLWHVSNDVSFGADIGSGWRAPNVEELFINGLQEGSLMYKIGNPDLVPEQSFSTDLLTRITGSVVYGEISAYYNRISHYIFLGPTGQIDSTSGVMKYVERQANATLMGADARLSGKVASRITLTVGGDFLLAKNEHAGTWLPLIPANRLVASLEFTLPSAAVITRPYFSTTGHIVFDQNRVDPSETRTPGYAVFDAGFGGVVMVFDRNVAIDCRINNLLDRAYHDHLSLYKLYAYEPGIDFVMNIAVPFVIIK